MTLKQMLDPQQVAYFACPRVRKEIAVAYRYVTACCHAFGDSNRRGRALRNALESAHDACVGHLTADASATPPPSPAPPADSGPEIAV